MRSDLLSRLFHSRWAAMIMVVVAAVYVILSRGIVSVMPQPVAEGIGMPAPSAWPLSAAWSTIINVVLNISIMVAILAINRMYNVLRSMSWLSVGLFALMQAATPSQVISLSSGSVVCVTVMLGLLVIFSTYSRPDNVRTVFTTFLLLSLGAAFEYAVVFFIPVFWIICLQMRIYSLRCAIASLMGIATAWILLLGLGIVSPGAIHMPRLAGIYSVASQSSELYVVALTIITAFMLFVSIVANIMKTIAYNARTRAYNGALLIVALATVAAIFFDFGNIAAYLPLLNVSAAYQITHYLVNHRYERQYIAILAVIFLYVLLCLWRLTI